MGVSQPHAAAEAGESFDPAEIRQIFDDDVDAVLDLIALVAKDLPRYAALLTEHVRCAEWSEAGRVAHTLKGAAANVYAPRVARLAPSVEHAATRGQLESIVEDSHALTASVDVLVQALERWAVHLRTTRREARFL